MPVRTALWTVGNTPAPLKETQLASEQLLEDMIVAAPRILSDEWMLIGRQENTGSGGRIDLLAIAPDGALVLIELKRDKSPRDVVAQALDYAAWVSRLGAEEIAAIYQRFSKGGSLAEDFRQRFGAPLDEETLNDSHQIVIVATALDPASERIVAYLNERNIPVNVLCFQVFEHQGTQLISRSWLLDPVQTQVNMAQRHDGPGEPWNGEFYCSFGQDTERVWEDAVEFGFVSAGGGNWYSKTLQLLSPGDRVWVNVPQQGYVGVGIVTGPVAALRDFRVMQGGKEIPFLEAKRKGHYLAADIDDADRCEYFVPVRWLQTVPVDKAFREVGMFGNQNTICRPSAAKWRWTVDRLKQVFPKHADVDV